MKKILAIMLVLVLTLSVFSACGDSTGTSADGSTYSSTDVSSSESSSSDSSSNSSSADSSTTSESTSGGGQSETSSDSSSDTQTISGSRRPVGKYTVSGTRQLPIYNVETDEKECAISFDAAWGADQTENLLAILDRYDIKATFFLVGRWVDEFPDMVKKIAEAGHDVMNHSDTHADLATLTYDEIIDEIESCNNKIEAITGVRPALIRLPYGSYNDTVVEAVRSLKMEPIQWSVDSLDWKEDIGAQDIYDRITSKTTSGSIILCHNAGEGTPEALPNVLDTLMGQGYKFTTIYDLIIKDDYTIDGNGMQKAINK